MSLEHTDRHPMAKQWDRYVCLEPGCNTEQLILFMEDTDGEQEQTPGDSVGEPGSGESTEPGTGSKKTTRVRRVQRLPS